MSVPSTDRSTPRPATALGARPVASSADDDSTIDLTTAGQSASTRRGRVKGVRSRARVPERMRAPRHRLLLVCVGVLSAGLLGVLLLNTIISQGAFRQHELEIQLILLAEKEEALARAVQQAETPLSVEKAARALGMVPARSPVFLRLEDGRILGEPVPAPAPTGPISFKGAPGAPITKPKASASPEASASPTAVASDGSPTAAPSPAPSAPSVGSPSPSVSAAQAPAPSSSVPAAIPSGGLTPSATASAASSASTPAPTTAPVTTGPTPVPTQSGVSQ